MFELVHFTNRLQLLLRNVQFTKISQKHLMCLNEFILASNSPPILALKCLKSSSCSEYEQIVRKLWCANIIDKNSNKGLENRAFETNAAIAQIGYRPY